MEISSKLPQFKSVSPALSSFLWVSSERCCFAGNALTFDEDVFSKGNGLRWLDPGALKGEGVDKKSLDSL